MKHSSRTSKGRAVILGGEGTQKGRWGGNDGLGRGGGGGGKSTGGRLALDIDFRMRDQHDAVTIL